MDEKKKYTGMLGTVSLCLLFALLATLAPMILWASQPQYQGAPGITAAVVMYGLAFLLWFPLLIAAFVTGLLAIIKNKGQKQGTVSLSIMGSLFTIAMVLSSISSS